MPQNQFGCVGGMIVKKGWRGRRQAKNIANDAEGLDRRPCIMMQLSRSHVESPKDTHREVVKRERREGQKTNKSTCKKGTLGETKWNKLYRGPHMVWYLWHLQWHQASKHWPCLKSQQPGPFSQRRRWSESPSDPPSQAPVGMNAQGNPIDQKHWLSHPPLPSFPWGATTEFPQPRGLRSWKNRTKLKRRWRWRWRR